MAQAQSTLDSEEVMRETLLLVTIGVAIGIFAALASTRLVSACCWPRTY